MKTNMLEDAISYAARKHAGQTRKGTTLPYIVHPMEVVAICATLTDDVEVLAAAALHDVVEDSSTSIEELEVWFSKRVAAIVAEESEDKREGMPAEQSWMIRKREAIDRVINAQDIGVKMVCLGDKLSNIRAIQRDYEMLGDELWERFNEKNPINQGWYYTSMAIALEDELRDTGAYQEFRRRVYEVFGRYGLDR